MIWSIIKQSALDFWEEMLYLILFNLIWVVGILLVIPYPLVTFGLFATVYDVGQGKGIKFSTFFAYARRTWKEAYIWGGINLGVLILLWLNLNFYAGIGTQWAAIVQVLILAVAIFWCILQLIVLPLYPRLETPGFKLALRNAAVIIGRYPMAIFILVIIIVLIGFISLLFQAVIFAGAAAFIAVVANRVVEEVVKREMNRHE